MTHRTAQAGALARTTLNAVRRLAGRDAVILTLNGASIPAAWIALWFALSNMVLPE